MCNRPGSLKGSLAIHPESGHDGKEEVGGVLGRADASFTCCQHRLTCHFVHLEKRARPKHRKKRKHPTPKGAAFSLCHISEILRASRPQMKITSCRLVLAPTVVLQTQVLATVVPPRHPPPLLPQPHPHFLSATVAGCANITK